MVTQRSILFLSILAATLLLVGFVSFIGFGMVHSIQCNKIFAPNKSINCTYQYKWLGLIPLTRKGEILDLSEIDIQKNCFTDGDTLAIRCARNSISLKNDHETVKISSHFLDEESALLSQELLENYISNNDSSTLTINHLKTINLILGIIFVAFPFTSLGVLIIRGITGDRQKLQISKKEKTDSY